MISPAVKTGMLSRLLTLDAAYRRMPSPHRPMPSPSAIVVGLSLHSPFIVAWQREIDRVPKWCCEGEQARSRVGLSGSRGMRFEVRVNRKGGVGALQNHGRVGMGSSRSSVRCEPGNLPEVAHIATTGRSSRKMGNACHPPRLGPVSAQQGIAEQPRDPSAASPCPLAQRYLRLRKPGSPTMPRGPGSDAAIAAHPSESHSRRG